MTRRSTFEDVLAKIDMSGGPDACWHWTGFVNHGGYGQITYQGKVVRVHRVVYAALVGPIPEGETIDHLCFNRICQNPRHLAIKTRSANAGRKKIRETNICRRGHDLTVTGKINSTGRRFCTECAAMTQAAHYEKVKRGEHVPKPMASCRRGHEPSAFKQHPDGRWYCSECKRITNKKPPVPKLDTCREGHDYAIHGKIQADGTRRCVTCHNARRRERYAAKS